MTIISTKNRHSGLKIAMAFGAVAMVSACGSSTTSVPTPTPSTPTVNAKNFDSSATAKPKIGTVVKVKGNLAGLGNGVNEITNAKMDADTDTLIVSRQGKADVSFVGADETNTHSTANNGATVAKYNAGNDTAVLAQTSDGSAYAIGYHQKITGAPILDEASAIIGGKNIEQPAIVGATFSGAYIGQSSLDSSKTFHNTIKGDVDLTVATATTVTGTIARNDGTNALQTLNIAGVVNGGIMTGVAVTAPPLPLNLPPVPALTGNVDAIFVDTDGQAGADEVVGSVVLKDNNATCTTGLFGTSACGVEVGTFHAK